MKIIKYLFFLLLITVIGGAVYLATLDGNFEIVESRTIEAPDELLFNTVNEYKTWEQWNPWMDTTNEMEISYAEQTSGDGASYSWKHETEGDGTMQTLQAVPYTSIEQAITFFPPFVGETKSTVYWNFEKIAPKQTKVTWGMKGKQSLMEKLFWLTQSTTLSESIQPMYAKGLKNLESLALKKMKAHTISVDGITEHGGGFYMYTATASAIAAIPQKMTQMFPTVQAYITQNQLPQTGMPFTVFNEFNTAQGTAIFSTAIPVREKVITPTDSNVLCDFLPRQRVVKVTLKGDYTYLKQAWQQGYAYVQEKGLEAIENAPAFEVYKTTPELQPNPAEWITEIYIPIQ